MVVVLIQVLDSTQKKSGVELRWVKEGHFLAVVVRIWWCKWNRVAVHELGVDVVVLVVMKMDVVEKFRVGDGNGIEIVI
ncbi:hypothetical protein C5167_005045 [Papaver somniferum]|uniref:Uncharacterized protein n=1 Tax=Papaver somniferum TaxID=3469 RepID=A0A4Y7JCK8_PAPSO|nr:hypothetical protein C5167_005045 [Papaver somniferum]